jgi:hypothetical protein
LKICLKIIILPSESKIKAKFTPEQAMKAQKGVVV